MAQKQERGGFSNQSQPQSDLPKEQIAPDASAAKEKIDALVKVVHGANDSEFPVVGNKISKVRASLVDAFNIPADALAFVNGEQVDGNYILQENDTLEFVKQAGVKGIS